jgi:hypothetical protein
MTFDDYCKLELLLDDLRKELEAVRFWSKGDMTALRKEWHGTMHDRGYKSIMMGIMMSDETPKELKDYGAYPVIYWGMWNSLTGMALE